MNKVPLREKLGYGVGAVGLDLSYGMFYSYLSLYLTNGLGIKPLFLLILAPLARLWDGINDPMMGMIVDKTHTKMGKYRPWILTGALLNAVVLCLLFNNPAYAVAFFGGATGSKLDSMDSACLTAGFGKWSMVTAAALVFFAVICVVSTKERKVVVNNDKFSFKQAIGVIKQNDQLLVFMLFAMISNAGFYMTSGISSYYFTCVAGNLKLQSTFNMFGTVGSVLSLLVIPVCSKFMSNRSTYRLSLLMAAAGYTGMAIVGYVFGGNVYALGAFYFLTSVGTGSMFVNQTVMLADVVDYGEYKLGKRNQALTFSMKGFLQKMAYTMQSIIMYAAFSMTGYDGSAAVQTAEANNAISFLMFIVPPVMIIVSLIVFLKKYRIHGEFKAEVLKAVGGEK